MCSAWKTSSRYGKACHDNLRPGGRLLVEATMPNMASFADSFSVPPRTPVEIDIDNINESDGTRLIRRKTTRYVSHEQRAQIRFMYEKYQHGRGVESYIDDFACHVFFPRELRLLFIHTGYEVEETFGDYRGGALRADSRVMITIGNHLVETHGLASTMDNDLADGLRHIEGSLLYLVATAEEPGDRFAAATAGRGRMAGAVPPIHGANSRCATDNQRAVFGHTRIRPASQSDRRSEFLRRAGGPRGLLPGGRAVTQGSHGRNQGRGFAHDVRSILKAREGEKGVREPVARSTMTTRSSPVRSTCASSWSPMRPRNDSRIGSLRSMSGGQLEVPCRARRWRCATHEASRKRIWCQPI